MVQAMRHGVMPRDVACGCARPHVDWSAGAVALLTEAVAVAGQRASAPGGGVLVRDQRHQRARDCGAGPTRLEDVDTAGGPGFGLAVAGELAVVPWVVSGKSVEALAAQAGRLLSHLQTHAELDAVDVGVSLAAAVGV